MALIDTYAAQTLVELRQERGLSPEALALAIAEEAKGLSFGQRGAVDAHTIRRIERHGHVPGIRVAFVLANYFGKRPDEIWDPRRARREVMSA